MEVEELGGVWESLIRVESIKPMLNVLSANFTTLNTPDSSWTWNQTVCVFL